MNYSLEYVYMAKIKPSLREAWYKSVGPKSDERPPADLMPEDVQLEDGSPLFTLWLQTNYGTQLRDVLDTPDDDLRNAKKDARRAIQENPDLVLKCQGKTRAQALEILNLTGFDQAAA